MKHNNHTPGPWHPVTQFIDCCHHHCVDDAKGDSVALCFTSDDAKLIAAAPELLNAAENVAQWLEQTYASKNYIGNTTDTGAVLMLEILLEAIEKATS
jgi:hypothetical protein